MYYNNITYTYVYIKGELIPTRKYCNAPKKKTEYISNRIYGKQIVTTEDGKLLRRNSQSKTSP